MSLLAIALFRWGGNRGMFVAAGLVGGVLGMVSGSADATQCRSVWEPGPVSVIVRVLDGTGTTLRTRASILHAENGCGGRVLVRLPAATPGGTILLAVGTYQGFGVLRVRHMRSVGMRVGWRLGARQAIARRIRALYGPRAGLVEALVLGRKDDLSPELRESFVGAGIAHLLAISGLHVGLLVTWLVMGIRATRLRRHALGIGAGLGWAYVALLGFPAAATRAAAFVSIYAFARYRQRHPAPLAVLTVAALAVAAIDPQAMRSVGAWLSITAVWATGYGPRQVPPRWRRLPLVRLAAASVAATLGTAPITAFAFGSVAPIGVATNLIAVPLAGIAVPAVFASLIVGATMAAGAGLALAAIEGVAAVAARVPGGHIVGSAGPAFALPWCVGLVATVWWLERRPAWRVVGLRTAVLAASGVWLAIAIDTVRSPYDDGGVTLHILDVGQGDAMALRTPHGRWVVIDAGPLSRTGDAGRRVVVPFLRQRRVRQLDALIVSHGDADHLGGVPAVMSALEPRLVLGPGQPLATNLYREHLATVVSLGAEWRAARAGDTLMVDGVRLVVLHPEAAWVDREFRANENSVVIRLEFGCFSALLTGDIGVAVERRLTSTLAPVAVLKVGHHGSAGSTSDSLLDALRPRVAVVSVGRNRYGHPAPAVLERLASRGVETFRTDRDGAVTIHSDGRYLEVRNRERDSFVRRLLCHVRPLLPSSNSSSSRNGCTPPRRVNLPICSTTSP